MLDVRRLLIPDVARPQMTIHQNYLERWKELVEIDRRRGKIIKSLLTELVDLDASVIPESDVLLGLLRRSLRTPSEQKFGVQMTEYLPQIYHCALIDDLLTIADDPYPQTGGPLAYSLITALPRKWLDEHFEQAVRRHLATFKLDSGLLLLCSDVHPELARELGQTASESDDEYQRDIGEWVLSRLREAQPSEDASN